MRKSKLIIAVLAVLAAGLAVAGCSAAHVPSGGQPPSAAAHTASSASTPAIVASPSPSATAIPSTAPSSPVTTSASPAASAVAIAVTLPAVCTPSVPVTPPGTLAEWLTISPNYAEFVQNSLVELLQPWSTAAGANAINAGLCDDVGHAKFAPPPADVAGYATVLKDAISGYLALRDGSSGAGEPPAYAAARPYFEAAEAAMAAFYAAIGHPITPNQVFPA